MPNEPNFKGGNTAQPISRQDKGFYVTVNYVPGGIKLQATPNIAEIGENTGNQKVDFYVLMEDFFRNGWKTVRPEDIDALTSGDIISDLDGNVYWHERYQIEDIVEELKQGNEVFMNTGASTFEVKQ